MSIPAIETGAFDQAGDDSNPNNSASAFTESPLHARDVSDDIGASWFMPTGNSKSIYILSEKPFKFDNQGNVVPSGTQYQQGQYCVIFFFNMPQSIDAAGTYLTVNDSSGANFDGQSDSGAGGECYFFLPKPAWQFVSYQDYYGAPWSGIPSASPVLAYAKWGQNAMNMMLSRPIKPGKYTGTLGLISSYIFYKPGEILVSKNNAVGGNVKFTVIAADLSKEIDVTPPGSGASNFDPIPPGNGGGRTRFSIDSAALLGSATMPFYPKIYVGNVPDPGIASAVDGNPNATCNYEGLWVTDIITG